MMGERTVAQEALFYSSNLKRHVPAGHLLRSVDRFVDLSGIREHLQPYYSETCRPLIDPELMIRMLLIGYCMGIRSQFRLCDEVHLNLAYRWFCRLGLEGDVPNHSTFSKNRHKVAHRSKWYDLMRRIAYCLNRDGSNVGGIDKRYPPVCCRGVNASNASVDRRSERHFLMRKFGDEAEPGEPGHAKVSIEHA